MRRRLVLPVDCKCCGWNSATLSEWRKWMNLKLKDEGRCLTGWSLSLCLPTPMQAVVTWKLSVTLSLWKPEMRAVQRKGLRHRPQPALNSTILAASREPLCALQKLSTNGNRAGFPPYAASMKTFFSSTYSALNWYERVERQPHLGLSAEMEEDLKWQKVKFLDTFNNWYLKAGEIWDNIKPQGRLRKPHSTKSKLTVWQNNSHLCVARYIKTRRGDSEPARAVECLKTNNMRAIRELNINLFCNCASCQFWFVTLIRYKPQDRLNQTETVLEIVSWWMIVPKFMMDNKYKSNYSRAQMLTHYDNTGVLFGFVKIHKNVYRIQIWNEM